MDSQSYRRLMTERLWTYTVGGLLRFSLLNPLQNAVWRNELRSERTTEPALWQLESFVPRARGDRYWKSTGGGGGGEQQSPLCILERMRDFIFLLWVCCWCAKVLRSFHDIIALEIQFLQRYLRRYGRILEVSRKLLRETMRGGLWADKQATGRSSIIKLSKK